MFESTREGTLSAFPKFKCGFPQDPEDLMLTSLPKCMDTSEHYPVFRLPQERPYGVATDRQWTFSSSSWLWRWAPELLPAYVNLL